VQFRSGETVHLNPNFEVENGSVFEAEIRDCDNLDQNFGSRVDHSKSKINSSKATSDQSRVPALDANRILLETKLGKAIRLKDDTN